MTSQVCSITFPTDLLSPASTHQIAITPLAKAIGRSLSSLGLSATVPDVAMHKMSRNQVKRPICHPRYCRLNAQVI